MDIGLCVRRWGCAIAIAAAVVGVGLTEGQGNAFAGKPPPPPASGRTIYFAFGGAPNVQALPPGATTPTTLAGTWLSAYQPPGFSKERYGGQWWQANRAPSSGTCPDTSAARQILVGALDLAMPPVLALNDPSYQVWTVDFRPVGGAGQPRLTFEGLHWVDGVVVESGLFQLDLAQDAAGLVTGPSGPPTLLLAFDCLRPSPTRPELMTDVRPHTWVTPNTLAYGDHLFDATGTFVGGELHTRTHDPVAGTWGDPSPALTPDANRALYSLNVSPNGTRFLFSNYGGIWEVPASGGAVLCWAATKGTRKGEVRPEAGDYVDDDTIAYTLHDIDTMGSTLSTGALYRKTRGGTTTQLTRSTEPYAQMTHAR